MIWIQGGVAFILWIGYGILQSRRSEAIRATVTALPRTRRGLTGAALLVIGAMVLLGGLGLVLQRGGFTSSGLTPAAWLIVAAIGLAFVHAQTLGMAMLVSLIQENVTNMGGSPSMNRTPGDRTQS